jgi:hypothetical protein
MAMTMRLRILALAPALVCRPQQQRKLPLLERAKRATGCWPVITTTESLPDGQSAGGAVVTPLIG